MHKYKTLLTNFSFNIELGSHIGFEQLLPPQHNAQDFYFYYYVIVIFLD